MQRLTYKFIFCVSLFSVFGISCYSQDLTSEAAGFNIFEMTSTRHEVVAEGQGYFPVLTRIDETVIAVFRAGGGHLGQGGRLVISRSEDQGTTWTTPTVVVDSPHDDRNPAVGITTNNRIIVGYHEQGSYNAEGKYDPSLKKARCMVTLSDDQGATWTTPKPLGVPGLERCSPYGYIVRLEDGTLLMNVYGAYTEQVPGMNEVNDNLKNYAYVVRSKDGGETWGDPSLIAGGHNETALLSLPDGRIMAAARSIGMAKLDMTISEDKGYTWSNTLRITGSRQHPGDLLLLSNGWILLFYGDRSVERKVIRGMITRDGGLTWDMDHACVFSRPVFGDFGYPSAVSLPDGQIAMMYYWAGMAKNSYDGSKAKAYINIFNESAFIDTYKKYISK